MIGRKREREREEWGEGREGIGEWDFVGDSLSPAVSSEPSASWIKGLASALSLRVITPYILVMPSSVNAKAKVDKLLR